MDNNQEQKENEEKLIEEYKRASEEILEIIKKNKEGNFTKNKKVIADKKDEAQALTEVYDVIKHLESNMYKKIPKTVIELIENNKDNNYIVNIDYSKNINEQIRFERTKIILSVIYRDYICSEDLRRRLQRYEYNILEKHK